MDEAGLPELLRGFVADTQCGEVVEVFARRVSTRQVVDAPDARVRISDHWQAELRSVRDERCGASVTADLSPAGLETARGMARLLRDVARSASVAYDALPPLATALPEQHRTPDGDGLSRLWSQAAEAVADVAITVADTVRSTMLVDSTGRHGGYHSSETQLHLRSTAPHSTRAQGSALATRPSGVDVDSAVAELSDSRRRMSGTPAAGSQPDWLVLSPLAAAQMLNRLFPGLCRGPVGDDLVGSTSVTIVDDGVLPEGPASAPFDDEGIPGQRTVVVENGRFRTALSGLPVSVSTGNSRRGDWRSGVHVAATNLFFAPDGDGQIDLARLPSEGMYVEQISGVPGRVNWEGATLPMTLHGAAVRAGEPTGPMTAVISPSGRQLLRAIQRVAGKTKFYRVNGVIGGSTCLLAGLDVRATTCPSAD
ncbi:MAG: metallopeptidase TldD-related protein [Stackebrandtia sp.]